MPKLIVIAGCNGAGKSTFATTFLPKNLTSFDYDYIYLKNYQELPDTEFRELFAKKYTTDLFENQINKAIEKKIDFCYETNFDMHPLFWPKRFRENGYALDLIFFCLKNQGIAQHRIQVRTEFKGHFVDNETIDLKWKKGYKNLNNHFDFFDNILIVDNSIQNKIYTNLIQTYDGEIFRICENLPDYIETRLPNIYELINNK